MTAGNLGLEVLQILSPVFLAALTWAAGKLARLIHVRIQNEDLRGILLWIDDAVLTAVKELQQTLVKQLKTASADGKLTDAEKQQLEDAALASVKSCLGEKGRAEVARITGAQDTAFEGLLKSKIQAAVHDLRSGAPASPAAPAVAAPPAA